jgi:hypothetical protein
MKSFKEMREARMVASADFKIGRSGRKVHKMKKVADDDYDKEDDDQNDDKKDVKEGAVPAHMQGKQKPYVSSDGKGNYEVLGNKGQTKAEFSRKEHGKDAHSKAQAHLKSKYDEYMKEDTQLDEEVSSGNAQHALHSKSEKEQHSAYMKKTHGVETKYHGSDELSYHGSKANVKKALVNHYDNEGEAKSLHPHAFKESVEMIDEAIDKQEQRFLQLARLGLVDKSNVSKLRIAVDQLKADKVLTMQQRNLLLGVMMDLVDLVTGDDTVFQRVKMDVQKEETDPPFDKPYTTIKPNVTDKSGAKHTPQSRVRHLAQLALKKQQAKSKE